MKTFWERVQGFFVSIHLIPASHVLDIYECLGFKGEKDDILVSHCLLLARCYIYCCKFKNLSPSIREYAQQLKSNLETEKQISTITDSQNKFQKKWHKILHGLLYNNCYIVSGQVPNVSLPAGYILYKSPYPDLKPLKIKIAKRCTSGFLFSQAFTLIYPIHFSAFLSFVIINIFFVIFLFFCK